MKQDMMGVVHSKKDCQEMACECDIAFEGRDPRLVGYYRLYPRYVHQYRRTNEEMIREAFRDLFKTYTITNGIISTNASLSCVEEIKSRLHKSENIKVVEAPFQAMYFPAEIPLYEPHPDIKRVARGAEICLLERVGKFNMSQKDWHSLWNQVTGPPKPLMEVRSLRDMCLSILSFHNRAFYNVGGIRSAVSAMADLYPTKVVETVLKVSRPQKFEPYTRHIMPFLGQALELLYDAMDTRQYFGTVEPTIRPSDLEGLYLGSSNGKHPGHVRKKEMPSGHVLQINPSGKKYENYSATIQEVRDFLMKKERAPMYCAHVFKDEIKHLEMNIPYVSPERYKKAQAKLRIFINASPLMVLLERLGGSKVRQQLEKGMIRVGSSWSYGGADFLAKQLGVYEDPFSMEVWEADFDGLDVSIREKLVELYYGWMFPYFRKTVTAEIFRKIMYFVIDEILNRLTHLFYDIWVIIRGLVPSGVWNTSHMDSWIVCLLFFWFLTYQMEKMTKEERLEVHRNLHVLVKGICLAVYGDDNLAAYKKKSFFSTYLNYYEWDAWLWKYFNMRLRDIRRSNFLSVMSSNGVLISRGATFLRMQIIQNPYVSMPGQPKFLPVRETQEIMMRLFWGRESKPDRDLLDLALSCIGHAWGCYASCRYTYDFLLEVYSQIIVVTGLAASSLVSEVFKRSQAQDIRQLRHKHLSAENILAGFPTWTALIEQNKVDPQKEFLARIF